MRLVYNFSMSTCHSSLDVFCDVKRYPLCEVQKPKMAQRGALLEVEPEWAEEESGWRSAEEILMAGR